MGGGPDGSASLPLILFSMWLLYIFSYSNFVDIVFRWSSMIVLLLSCNLDVAMGGDDHSLSLLCHVDQILNLILKNK